MTSNTPSDANSDDSTSQHDPTTPPELTDEQVEFLNSLFDLARAGDADQLLPLLDQGIPVDLTNHRGDTLLILATYNDHASLAQELIQRGADVNHLNERGQSALSCAVFVQNEESVRALLAAGADPDAGPVSARAAVEMFGLESMRSLLDGPTGNTP
ncbi:ankyrin repeat domain-containing protein [Citricoccus sp. GCM10030269]|uniref:ankyrin repeat domain-containing protein n=1 Tax=Citricoccus sp. GCM10030269 TaxID=3273388 RepID=UPI003617F5E2